MLSHESDNMDASRCGYTRIAVTLYIILLFFIDFLKHCRYSMAFVIIIMTFASQFSRYLKPYNTENSKAEQQLHTS